MAARGLPPLQYLELQIAPVHTTSVHEQIDVITIDSDTAERLGDPPHAGLVDRRHHADLIRGLKLAGAKAVAFDLYFSDPDQHDDELQSAINDSSPMTVALAAEAETVERNSGRPEGAYYTFRMPAVLPFMSPASVMISHSVSWDPDGATVLGAPLILTDAKVDGVHLPHLAFSAWLGAHGLKISDLKWEPTRGGWSAGGRFWPVGSDGNYSVLWNRDVDSMPAFEYSRALTMLKDPKQRSEFRDHIVVVGSTAEGSRNKDLHLTPVGEMAGDEFVANAVNSLGAPDDEQRGTPRRLAEIALAALGALVGAGLMLNPRPVVTALLLAEWVILWYAAPALEAPRSTSLLAAILAALAMLALGSMSRTRMLERAVSRYLRNPVFAGRPRQAAVLFADLAGSTAAIAAMDPQSGVRYLAEVVNEIVNVVHECGGEVERTMGDGALVLFYEDQRSDYALRCLRTIDALRDRFGERGPEFDRQFGRRPALTFGAETGPVNGKVLRTERREEWSIFGITIHLAARLQSAAGGLGVEALIGEQLATHTLPERVRPVEPLELKGIGSPTIYQYLPG